MRRIAALSAAAALLAGACSHGHLARPAGASATVPSSPATAATSAPAFPVHDGVIEHGSRSIPIVALTFDSNMTASMLHELDTHRIASFDNHAVVEVLDRMHVPATFFLSGLWMERYGAEARTLAADPLFELGSHSYLHEPFAAHCYGLGHPLATADMAPDVERSEAVLRTFTDHPTPYFRFPGGCYDAQAVAAIGPAGVTVIEFDLASGDAFLRSAKAIVQHVLTNVHDGSIVVLHITGGNTAPLTAEALPGIVDGLRTRGFELVRVSELLARSGADIGLETAPPQTAATTVGSRRRTARTATTLHR